MARQAQMKRCVAQVSSRAVTRSRALRCPEGPQQQRLERGVASLPRVELVDGSKSRHAMPPPSRPPSRRPCLRPASRSSRRPPAAGSTCSNWPRRGPNVTGGGTFSATRPTESSPRPPVLASPTARKPVVAATRSPSVGVSAVVGGYPLPTSRPEQPKSLRMYLAPPGWIPPSPEASVGAS